MPFPQYLENPSRSTPSRWIKVFNCGVYCSGIGLGILKISTCSTSWKLGTMEWAMIPWPNDLMNDHEWSIMHHHVPSILSCGLVLVTNNLVHEPYKSHLWCPAVRCLFLSHRACTVYPKQKEVQTTLQHLQSFHQRGHCGSHPSRLSAEKACFNMHISYKQQPSDQTSAHFSRFSFQIEFYHVPSGSGTPGIAFESIGLVLTDLWWHVVPSAVTESATVQLLQLFNCPETNTAARSVQFQPSARSANHCDGRLGSQRVNFLHLDSDLCGYRDLSWSCVPMHTPQQLKLAYYFPTLNWKWRHKTCVERSTQTFTKAGQSRGEASWVVLVLRAVFICERYIL